MLCQTEMAQNPRLSAERSIPLRERSKSAIQRQAKKARRNALKWQGRDATLFLLWLDRWSVLMWVLGHEPRSLDVQAVTVR